MNFTLINLRLYNNIQLVQIVKIRINKFSMKKISLESMRAQQPRPTVSLSLRQIFTQYCSHPHRPFILAFRDRTCKLIESHPPDLNPPYCNSQRGRSKADPSYGRRQDNSLFAHVLGKMGSSKKSGRSSKGGSDYSNNHENDSGDWQGQNQNEKVNQVAYKLGRNESKSPLKRIFQQQSCQFKNRSQKAQNKTNFSSYNIINKTYDKDKNNQHRNPYTSAFTCKIAQEIQETKKQQQQQKHKKSQSIPTQSISDMLLFKKISSQIKQPIKLVELSFQNFDNFINLESSSPGQPHQEQKLESIKQNISNQNPNKVEGTNKRSIIQSLASGHKNSVDKEEQLACQESIVKVLSKFSEIKGQEKKMLIQEQFQNIVNPYAKPESFKQKIEEEDQPIENEKQKQQQKISKVSIKLTDEQVCKIISSRKKAINSSKKNLENQDKGSQQLDFKKLLDISDLDVNALLKIQDSGEVKGQVKQQKPTPSQASLLKATPLSGVPLVKQLNSSFIPHYYLNRSPRGEELATDTIGYSLFVPSNINSTKPAESQVYQNRRLSEQSEQPSSLVFQLSANSNF